MKRSRVYSRHASEAARLLGAQIRSARRRRQWSAADLAERVGVSPFTLRKVEQGDMTVGLGVAFEAAALVGVPLFYEDQAMVSLDADRTEARAALLPRRVARPTGDVDDAF
jgi:transcriptional regulator with XRE-family HTH domain